MCGCGGCTEEQWIEGLFCEKSNKDYPHFMMLDPFRDCHAQIKKTEIYFEAREMEKKFRVCCLRVWQKLICDVKVTMCNLYGVNVLVIYMVETPVNHLHT